MNQIVTISLHTVRELLRDRLLYNLVCFGLVLIGSSVVLSRLTVGEANRMVMDLGLASINLFGVAIAILIGIALIHRELDRRTVYLILTKPVPRPRLVIGKFLGLCATLLLNVAIMASGFIAVLWMRDIPVTTALFQALFTIYLELAVIAAIAVLCSASTTTTLSAMWTVSLYVIGHSLSTLQDVGAQLGGSAKTMLTGLVYLFPNLEWFNLKGAALGPHTMAVEDLALLTGYAASYCICLLGLATVIFQRRDLL